MLSLAALKWFHGSVSAPVFSCAFKHLRLLDKYSVSSQQEAFIQLLTKLLLTEGKFSAMVWKAREMGLAEPKLYEDDERNVFRPFPGATCVFASAG